VTKFVNPYTFVPHVAEPERRAPTGHAVMPGEQFSGILDITLRVKTPLMIGGYGHRDASGMRLPEVPERADGTQMIPGSGLLGAVRSVHEALTGSCLRVFDADRVPVHRHPASTAETDGLRLAIATELDYSGRVTKVALCDEKVVWIDQELLPRTGGRLPRTGDRLDVPWGKAVEVSPGRWLLRAQDAEGAGISFLKEMHPGLGESGVLLVTDTRARSDRGRAYFAAGRLGQDAPVRAVSPEVWKAYCETVRGADDLRPAVVGASGEPSFGSAGPAYADVAWPNRDDHGRSGPLVGQRLRARRYLHPGQPVWVRLAGEEVTEIRLSRLWRYQGNHKAGDRAGAAVPCTDPESLCWSCRIFGSADTSGRKDHDIARQRSYRGHVRIDDLVTADRFEPVLWDLAPLAAPKPGAGQFYLDNTGVPESRRLAAKDTRPAATWGSCADERAGGWPNPRPIRGRKFYWRTVAPDQGPQPRGQYRHQADTMTSRAALIPAGTVFTGRVCFENLSAADYGSLLAALDLRLLALAGVSGWDEAVTALGGGKPFGFGSVQIEVRPAAVQTAVMRYLGAPGEVPEVAAAVTAFRARLTPRAAAAWPAIRNAQALGFVSDELVWYPPGPGAKGDPEFDRSFEFFSRTTGLAQAKKVRDLVVLPSAAQSAAEQELDSAGGERPQEDVQRRQRGRRP
jgi:CRISPR-associated protein (TIGR03986 family)